MLPNLLSSHVYFLLDKYLNSPKKISVLSSLKIKTNIERSTFKLRNNQSSWWYATHIGLKSWRYFAHFHEGWTKLLKPSEIKLPFKLVRWSRSTRSSMTSRPSSSSPSRSSERPPEDTGLVLKKENSENLWWKLNKFLN